MVATPDLVLCLLDALREWGACVVGCFEALGEDYNSFVIL